MYSATEQYSSKIISSPTLRCPAGKFNAVLPHERKLIYFNTVWVCVCVPEERLTAAILVWSLQNSRTIAVQGKVQPIFLVLSPKRNCSIGLTLLMSFVFTHTHPHPPPHTHTKTQLAVKHNLQSLSFIPSPRMAAFRIESHHPTGHPVTVAVARTRVKETQCRIPQ